MNKIIISDIQVKIKDKKTKVESWINLVELFETFIDNSNVLRNSSPTPGMIKDLNHECAEK